MRYTADGTTTNYYYITNLQGDVLCMITGDGRSVGSYSYDPYGKVLTSTGEMANINPLRYRGYYYDMETGFYYLQSRYYDPELCRFINSDSYASTGQGIIGHNMFAYCGNNPSSRIDVGGESWVSTIWWIIQNIEEILDAGNAIAIWIGIDTAAVGAFVLDMYESSDGVYHANFDCWQQYFGYNDLYDIVFDIGTSMETANFPFSHNGEEYIIWVWKGDYINLGAGAELGIYYGGGPHWLVNKRLAMDMKLTLSYNGNVIISHSQHTWWITGFNSNYQNVSASALTATFTISFYNDRGLFYSFYHEWGGIRGWTFDVSNYTATYTF